jgi:multidrug efflux pump subunit AcrB
LLSWITALTLTPFLCHLLFNKYEQKSLLSKQDNTGEAADPYHGFVYEVYRKILTFMLHNRGKTT